MNGAGKRWRVGSHYGIHVYEGEVPVATFVGPADFAEANAASVVAEHNARLDAEPQAWAFELAGSRNMASGEYGMWQSYVAFVAPKAGAGQRNVRPLYTHTPDATAELATLRADLAKVTAERDEARESEQNVTDCFVEQQGFTRVAEARASAAEAALATALRALELNEAWEAHIVLRADWDTEDGLPHLTQKQMDALNEVQDRRNDALAQIRSLTPPAEAEGGKAEEEGTNQK